MKKEFLEAYNQELALLYERSREFAEEYPGIAERLGGLTEDKLDPGLAGLLEGSAFLAARVQLKLQSEFSTFTRALLDQLLPNYLAPTPAAMIVQATPDYSEKDLAKGEKFPAGAYLDATYVEREQRVSARFRLSAPLTLWPFDIDRAAYLPSPGPIQSLGIEVSPETSAGLRLRLFRRTTNEAADPEAKPKKGEKPLQVNEVRCDELPIHLTGNTADMIMLYEQLFSNTNRVTLRYLDRRGDPVFLRCPPDFIQQIGFDQPESLYPEDDRVFQGFSLLRDFYTLPQKFLGFRLTGLQALLKQIPSPMFDVIIEFDTAQPKLAPLITPDNIRLYAAPAINLFEERCSRVRPDPKFNEFIVVPDSSPAVNYELHRIIDVKAHYPGVRKKVQVHPLYSLPDGEVRPQDALYFTTRHRPRRLTEKERRFGFGGSYVGTETYMSLFEPAGLDDEERVQRLQVVALCSNRHLVTQLPIGQSEVDFRLTDDVTVALRCISGPTAPRESIAEMERADPRLGHHGEVLWRLVNLLSFNHLGLKDRHPTDPAGGLREILSLFSDQSDSVTERQLRGINGIASRPITRSLRRDDGFHAARGTEVKLTFDERAFEGSGIMLLGAVLDRFFADYTHINSFTETVLISEQRGEVMRFPPRSGTGPLL
ncbi:type VI secretion system baseplate subunit TssF [Actibacterium sp. 188UL27-1]|uniref:type VI secretion system baseplate subunit TssF n=1 Tax=Actibacterium sp. 188UL27-1 TaxID=2786961 RepID=UPI001958D32C|nr:type VI secretion system baseplate subunit TssF [Actibacterium sp. 188UL27-1]MBM7068825.1 type VI secretion system baseplate subunit TssF [Actibacterium sp. 188UL27-1]